MTWSAVFGGAVVGAALSLILLALGAGLGLSSISPWANGGASATTIGRGAIGWLILMQIIASSVGGYLAGRLRTKWAQIHTDEVYFRDTAHGFLVWAVAHVILAGFLASAAATMAGGAAHAGIIASAASGGSSSTSAPSGGTGTDPNGYFVDSMLRANPASPPSAVPYDAAATKAEAALIFANGLRQGQLPDAHRAYLAQTVAARTGLSTTAADKRVSDAFAQAQQAIETARKAAANLSLWLFLAFLVGAFCASLAATFGGAQRDRVVII